MRELLQVRFGEIHLKGQNRPYFMRMLVERVREAVKDVQGHVWLNDSRVYVSDMTDMDARLLSVREWYRLCPAGWEDAETPAFLARTTEIRKNCQNPLRFPNISCIMPVG